MIKIYYDESAEMMKIVRGNTDIFEGNYWDFESDPSGLQSFLADCGLNCQTVAYSYDDEGESDEI